MEKSIFLFIFMMIFFLSCSSDPFVLDEKILDSERSQEIYTQLQKQGIQLSEYEIEKLKKIEEIAKKYDVEAPEKYGAEFSKFKDDWLNMSLEEAERLFKEIHTYKLYGIRSSDITEKWAPKLLKAETKEKHDELYKEYKKELNQLEEEIFGDLDRYSHRIFNPEN